MDRIGPGAVLAGRYRLVERLEGDPVASLWQAEDTTLERRAAVRILAAGHSHVDATLDAARRSAVIDDPRLQRVLGVGVEAGAGYVILEWVEGPTAVQLAGRVTEEEACRIASEVADALAHARSKGLRHARLTPGHVRRGADGRVRISGLAIDAALIGRGIEPTREDTDVADTVALVYALISGRWPFGFVEGLLGAPYQSGKPVPLRELTPTASSAIEELCLRTFAGEPPATASILAAALASRVRRPAADGAAGASGPAASAPEPAVPGAVVAGAVVAGAVVAGAVVAGATAAVKSAAGSAPGPFARPVTVPARPAATEMTGADDPSERTVELTPDTTPPPENAGADDPSERTVDLTTATTGQAGVDATESARDGDSAVSDPAGDGRAQQEESDTRADAERSATSAPDMQSPPRPTGPMETARSATAVGGVVAGAVVAGGRAQPAAPSAAGAAVPSLFTPAATATPPATPPAPSLFTAPSKAAAPTAAAPLLPGERRAVPTREPAANQAPAALSRDARTSDPAGQPGQTGHPTIELPDVAAVMPTPPGDEATVRPVPAALRQEVPTGGASAASSVLPQSQRRGRTVTLPDAIEGHTRLPQWRRASDAVLAGGAGRARKSGMQWSADPDDGWSLLPGEARGPEDSDWRGDRGTPTGTVPPYDDRDPQWDLAGDDHDDQPSRRRRSIVGAVVIVALMALVIAGGVWAFNRADLFGGANAGDSPTVTVTAGEPSVVAPPPAAEAPAAAPATVTIVGVQTLDPPPGDSSERDTEAPAAIDGDPGTAWSTETYNSQNFGGLKEGVGLLVALGQPATVSSATLSVPGTAGTFEIRSSTQPAYEGSAVIAIGETSDGGPVTLTWDPIEAPYIIVWFTALPGAGSEWRGTIAEIQLA